MFSFIVNLRVTFVCHSAAVWLCYFVLKVEHSLVSSASFILHRQSTFNYNNSFFGFIFLTDDISTTPCLKEENSNVTSHVAMTKTVCLIQLHQAHYINTYVISIFLWTSTDKLNDCNGTMGWETSLGIPKCEVWVNQLSQNLVAFLDDAHKISKRILTRNTCWRGAYAYV
jgi:hypothetical protein